MTRSELLGFIVSPILIGLFIFVITMFLLRQKNFDEHGKRKSDWRKLTSDLRSAQIQYHNEAVYKAFEFYIKIILALFGAIGLISISADYKENANLKVILEFSGIITIGINFLFGFLYISHQKAKIERWEKKYKWYEPLFWNECWLFTSCITMAVIVNYMLIPKLLENL